MLNYKQCKFTNGRVEMVNTTVPATAVFNGGVAFKQDGTIYVTTSGTYFPIGKMSVTDVGRLGIDTGAVAYNDGPFGLAANGELIVEDGGTIATYADGFGFTSAGKLCVVLS